MTGFDTYAVCPCGMHERIFKGVMFFASEVCHNCGKDKSHFKKKVCRWVPTGKILKPSTWGNGHWEYAPDRSLRTTAQTI